MKYLLISLMVCLMSCTKLELDVADCYPVTEILINVQTNQVLEINHNSNMCDCQSNVYAVNTLNRNKIIYAVKCIPK